MLCSPWLGRTVEGGGTRFAHQFLGEARNRRLRERTYCQKLRTLDLYLYILKLLIDTRIKARYFVVQTLDDSPMPRIVRYWDSTAGNRRTEHRSLIHYPDPWSLQSPVVSQLLHVSASTQVSINVLMARRLEQGTRCDHFQTLKPNSFTSRFLGLVVLLEQVCKVSYLSLQAARV